MKKILIAIACGIAVVACSPSDKSEPLSVTSPNNNVQIGFYLDASGQPGYFAKYGDKSMVDSSALGFILHGDIQLKDGFSLANSTMTSFDETWEQPWGEERFIKNNYNELKVNLTNANGAKMNISFRAFDDGIAFRYEFPEQDSLSTFEIMDELTEFNLAANDEAWWIPAYGGNRYEYIYEKNNVNTLNKIHTPVTIEAENGLFMAIHEASLIDYSSMVLVGDGSGGLKCDLVPWSKTNPVKVYVTTPFTTPWRTISVGEKAGDLITNYMGINLNAPNAIGDVSWVKPGKYMGVWWEMFIQKGTWEQGPKHAANTANVKKYLDFASKHGFSGVLVEGWNYGWDGDWMNGGTKFEFTKPYPDYDIDELTGFAQERGVYIIGHHETGADVENYESQLEDAYKYLHDKGLKAVKTGYVENGDTLPNGLYHHGQYFVRHFRKVMETGARHKTMIVAHEPMKDTGERRTYPNMVSREGAKGQEYNAMGGNPPGHVTIVPFTRSLAGPFDYTPGIFDLKLKTMPNEQVKSTLTRELALYVIIYAPMQMASDLPENYEGHPAFKFIEDVPTDWETTKVLDGKIGEHVSIARQQRGTDNWFVGTISNENPRTSSIAFDFLTVGKKYKATIYRNSDDADYMENPTGYAIDTLEIDSNSKIDIQLASAGGAAIAIYPVE